MPGNTLSLTEGWSLTLGYEHHWNANWRTSLWGDYGKINYSDGLNSASQVLCGGNVVCPTTSADWDLWQIGSRTVWTPVENLDLSLEVMYNKMNSAFGNAPAGALGTTAGATNVSDQDWWSGMIRVQRNFMP